MCLINHGDVNLLILRISSKFHCATNKKWVFKSETKWLKIETSSIHTEQTSDSSRAGTIQSAANMIHIRYDMHVSKSINLDFNNKVNVLG